jgi:malate dehydrogenase
MKLTTVDQVTGYEPTPEGLKNCLTGAEIVVIPAGVPRKPGMTRDGTYLRNKATCNENDQLIPA